MIEHGRSNGPAPAPTWQELERNLAGSGDLASLIEELSAQVGPQPETPAILEVLGTHLRDILDRGLVASPPDVLETLVRHPSLLRNLQDLVFAEGGDYWLRLIDQAAAEMPPEYQAIVERARKKLEDLTKGD
jgi:hypothetical protein